MPRPLTARRCWESGRLVTAHVPVHAGVVLFLSPAVVVPPFPFSRLVHLPSRSLSLSLSITRSPLTHSLSFSLLLSLSLHLTPSSGRAVGAEPCAVAARTRQHRRAGRQGNQGAAANGSRHRRGTVPRRRSGRSGRGVHRRLGAVAASDRKGAVVDACQPAVCQVPVRGDSRRVGVVACVCVSVCVCTGCSPAAFVFWNAFWIALRAPSFARSLWMVQIVTRVRVCLSVCQRM